MTKQTRLFIPASVLAITLLAGSALAQGDNANSASNKRCFNGYAYTLKGGEYRYTEHDEQTLVDGKVMSWNVVYVGRGGKTIATKQMDFSANQTVPTYTLEIPADGYEEGIRHEGGTWTMFRKRSAGAKEETKPFKIDPPMAADSGFNALVLQNFDKLENGKNIPFKFVAAGRQGVIGLRASKIGNMNFKGKNAVVFKAELDIFLVNYFVDSLKLTYDPDSKRLLQYRGIGNMHDGSGKVYPVRVNYASRMPKVARENGAPAARCGS